MPPPCVDTGSGPAATVLPAPLKPSCPGKTVATAASVDVSGKSEVDKRKRLADGDEVLVVLAKGRRDWVLLA